MQLKYLKNVFGFYLSQNPGISLMEAAYLKIELSILLLVKSAIFDFYLQEN